MLGLHLMETPGDLPETHEQHPVLHRGAGIA